MKGAPKFDDDTDFAKDDMHSQIMDDHETFQNVFAKPNTIDKPESSQKPKLHLRQSKDIPHTTKNRFYPNLLCQRWSFLISMDLIPRYG